MRSHEPAACFFLHRVRLAHRHELGRWTALVARYGVSID